MKQTALWVALAAVGGCAGSDGMDGEGGRAGDDGLSTLSATSKADKGDCPAGGSVIAFGLDKDEDGKLDESEVESTALLCNGEPGEQGEEGEQGLMGEPGEMGEQGEPGEMGEQGESGEQGEPGEMGEQGAAAEAPENIGKIEASLGCGGQLENTTLWFSYNAVVFTDGSVWASGAIKDALSQSSNSAFYAPEQNGALSAVVIMTYDAAADANSGWWSIEVNRADSDALVALVVYHDVDVDGGERAWTMDAASAGCVWNQYD